MLITIISDAGTQRNELGAAATILLGTESGGLEKHVALLQGLSATEAEFYGGILGLERAGSSKRILWHTDRDGAIHRATRLMQKTVPPSSHLEEYFAQLASNCTIEIVRASGKKILSYHERCHRAATWIQQQGEKLLAKHGEGLIGDTARFAPQHAWRLWDRRSNLSYR